MIYKEIINNGQSFPRKLSSLELNLLFFILPENRKGYKEYSNLIQDKYVIGYGRFGDTNLILGDKNDKPDLSIPSSNVFAIGSKIYEEGKHYILIHEDIEGLIEFDISYSGEKPYSDEMNIVKQWTYSNWLPGENAPDDNSEIREINILNNEYILAIAVSHKRIWLYEKETQVNHLIPVTNFYNDLMLIKQIKDPGIALKSDYLFNNIDKFSDEELVETFLNYNKKRKKVKLDYKKNPSDKSEDKKSGWKNLFKRS